MAKRNIKTPKMDSTPTQTALVTAIRDYEPISRTRLADLTGIQHAAVSRAVASLLDNGLVVEKTMADSVGPRRKRGLCLNPDHGYVIGMEYSPEGMEAVAVNFGYQPMKHGSRKKTIGRMNRTKKCEEIVAFLKAYQRTCKSIPGTCFGVSLLDPGLVDTKRGRTVMCSVMDDWQDVPIVDIVSRELKLPVLLPQAEAAKVRAVDRFEIKGDRQNLLYIEYGDGIACGLKLGGNYITGSSNFAGEMGHVHATDKEILCRCGAVGCLEAVSALPALTREADNAIQNQCDSSLASVKNITGDDVLKAAAKGDRLACRIVGDAFEYLAQVVSDLVIILNPEMLVFDSRMKIAGDAMSEDFVRSIIKKLSSLYKDNIEIRFSEIESHLGALGAGFALMDTYIESSSVT
jgi:predicted NBD/HSP70 family sugar kinase/biotin operon repressor